MPRKERPLKNKYCKRSKFAEDEFVTLVRYYFHEVLYGDSRNNYCFYFKYWHKVYGRLRDKNFAFKPMQLADAILFPSYMFVKDGIHKNKPERDEGKNEFITRQRISNIFNKISQYLWDNHVITQHQKFQHVINHPLPFQEEDFFDGLLDLIYGKTEKLSTPYKMAYDVLCYVGIPLTKDDITSTLMFHWLSNRSKVVRGFKKDKFYLEFSRVFFICLIVRTSEVKFSSIYSFKDGRKLVEVLTRTTIRLLLFLEEKPM